MLLTLSFDLQKLDSVRIEHLPADAFRGIEMDKGLIAERIAQDICARVFRDQIAMAEVAERDREFAACYAWHILCLYNRVSQQAVGLSVDQPRLPEECTIGGFKLANRSQGR